MERVNIEKLINKSRVHISLKSKDNSFKMKIEVYLNENIYEEQKL